MEREFPKQSYGRAGLLGFLCVLSSWVAASAEEIPAAILKDRTEYYSILREDKKSGWFRAQLSRTELDGKKVFREQLQWQEVGLFFGRKQTSTSVESSYYEEKPPYRLLRHEESHGEREFKLEVVVVPDGGLEEGKYRIEVKEGEHTREAKLGDGTPLTLRDSWRPEIAVMSKPKIGVTFKCRALNSAEFKLDDVTIEILSKEGDDTYQIGMEMEPIGRFLTGAIKTDGSWKDFQIPSGEIFRREESEEKAKEGLGEYSFETLWEVPVDKPLGDPGLITEMVVSAKGNWSDLLERNAFQTYSYNPFTQTTTIKVGKRFGRVAKVTPEERKKALQATGPIPSNHEKIRKMAEEETKGAKSDWDKVERLCALVARSLDYQIDLDPLSVLEALKHKRGDCSEHSDLFAALARSIGLPARSISGWVYMGDDYGSFAYHGWNEVAIDGKWVAIDSTWGELVPNATHIKMEFEEADLKFTKMFREGQLAFRLKTAKSDAEATLKVIDDAIEKYPKESTWLAARASRYVALRRGEEASKDLLAAIKLSPEIAEYQALLSSVYMEVGMTKLAIATQKKATELFPSHPAYWTTLGWYHFEAQQYAESIEVMKRALKLQPGSAELLGQIGYCYYFADESEEALNYLEKALKISPNDPNLHSVKGMALEDLDRIKEAIKAFSRVIELSPEDGLNRYLRAGCLATVGDRLGAIKDLQMALKLDLDDEDRASVKEMLETLKEAEEEEAGREE